MNVQTLRFTDLFRLSKMLGFKGMKSFAKLYKGGTLNAFGHPENSMPTFWIYLNGENLVTDIEVHRTYFKPTPEILKLNEFIGDEPKPIYQLIELLENNIVL